MYQNAGMICMSMKGNMREKEWNTEVIYRIMPANKGLVRWF